VQFRIGAALNATLALFRLVDKESKFMDMWSYWVRDPVAIKSAFNSLVLFLMFAAFCPAESLTPAEALDRYVTASSGTQPVCADTAFAVQIDASLPKLGKQGSMSGLKLVAHTGQIDYEGLRFQGDSLIKTAVIARFLAKEKEKRAPGLGVVPENYLFILDRTSGYNGLAAYVFRLKPKRKRAGLFKGELWLDATTGTPLRLWGDLVKSPSFFIRNLRFVQDYLYPNQCRQPVRLIVTVQTRIVGQVELVARFRAIESQPVPTENLAISGASGN